MIRHPEESKNAQRRRPDVRECDAGPFEQAKRAEGHKSSIVEVPVFNAHVLVSG